jgi:hypothetical protein
MIDYSPAFTAASAIGAPTFWVDIPQTSEDVPQALQTAVACKLPGVMAALMQGLAEIGALLTRRDVAADTVSNSAVERHGATMVL